MINFVLLYSKYVILSLLLMDNYINYINITIGNELRHFLYDKYNIKYYTGTIRNYDIWSSNIVYDYNDSQYLIPKQPVYRDNLQSSDITSINNIAWSVHYELLKDYICNKYSIFEYKYDGFIIKMGKMGDDIKIMTTLLKDAHNEHTQLNNNLTTANKDLTAHNDHVNRYNVSMATRDKYINKIKLN